MLISCKAPMTPIIRGIAMNLKTPRNKVPSKATPLKRVDKSRDAVEVKAESPEERTENTPENTWKALNILGTIVAIVVPN